MAGLYDLAPWLDDPVLGSELKVIELMVACGIILFSLVSSLWIPGLISRSISSFFIDFEKKRLLKRKKKRGPTKEELDVVESHTHRTLELPLRRGLVIIYVLIFIFIALTYVDLDLNTEFNMGGVHYEAYRFVQWASIMVFFFFLAAFVTEPLVRASVYALFSQRMSNSQKYRLYRSLRIPVRVFFVILGLFWAFSYSFTKKQMIIGRTLTDILLFVLIITTCVVVARLTVALMMSSRKVRGREGAQQRKSIGRLIQAAIFIVGGFVGMLAMGLDPITIGTSLGLIGFALAFGLQDTVANFAAGIMITMDKPFVIGDRIRLDWGGRETWGDVTDISLRSTWIKTPEDEMIVIPNMLIASQQLWNYTRDSPKVAVETRIGISYDSDWRLAEKLMLDILNTHPLVLSKPPPHVWMSNFGEFSVDFKVRYWAADARDKWAIQSDILKKIKDSFDKNGVEIPFPYRTLVNKTEIEKPKRLEEPFTSPVYLPSAGFKRAYFGDGAGAFEMEEKETIVLSPTSAPYPAKMTAPYVMDLAKRMNATVAALYIQTDLGDIHEGKKALRIYNQISKLYNVSIKLIYEEGDVLERILHVAETEGVSLVVMGSTEESLYGSLTRRSITQELLTHLNVPTLIVPFKGEAMKKYEELKKKGDLLKVEEEIKEEEADIDEKQMAAIADLESMMNKGP